MNHRKLAQELFISLRGTRTQGQIAKRLHTEAAKISKIENGRMDIYWINLVQMCQVSKVDLQQALQTAFSYSEKDVTNTKTLLKHFTGKVRQADLAKSLKVSPATVSRWLQDKTQPTLAEIFSIMEYSSTDFARFIYYLNPDYKKLPTIADRIKVELTASQVYFKFPWMSIFLAAIDLKEYKTNPSTEFLQKKTALTKAQIEQTIQESLKVGFLQKKGGLLVSNIDHFCIWGDDRQKKELALYNFSTVTKAIQKSYGVKSSRISSKMFSLNKAAYPIILQKYTEFFNELAVIIDQHQEDADGVYLFSAGIIDMDDITDP